jgi:hypothetical protein
VNETLGQPMLLAARLPPKGAVGHFGVADCPKLGEEIKDNWRGGAVGSQATASVTVVTGVWMKMTTAMGNEMKDLQETWEQVRRSEWRSRNNRGKQEVWTTVGKPAEKVGCQHVR